MLRIFGGQNPACEGIKEMEVLAFFGVIFSFVGWYFYFSIPNWINTGVPAFIEPIVNSILNIIRDPFDIFGIEAISKLRDYSLFVGAVGTIMLIVALAMASKRRPKRDVWIK